LMVCVHDAVPEDENVRRMTVRMPLAQPLSDVLSLDVMVPAVPQPAVTDARPVLVTSVDWPQFTLVSVGHTRAPDVTE